jgi:hypothetical protein
MRRQFAAGLSFLAMTALAACGGAERANVPAASTPPIPADNQAETEAATSTDIAARFGGTWYVSGVFPAAAASASTADPHLGAALTIGAEEVSDVNGQRCITPSFASDQVQGATIGLKFATGTWERLVVTCDGKDFATYLRLPDRAGDGPALMQQRREALYLLEPAAALQHRAPSEQADSVRLAGFVTAPKEKPAHDIPATNKTAAETAGAAPTELAPKTEPATKAKAPAPMPEGPVAETPTGAAESAQPVAKPAAAAGAGIPAPGSAMHLASYKGQSAAKRGWKILLGEYDELDPLSPLYVTVDVPGKGEMVRLYASGAEPAEIKRICAALQAKKVYCALNP